MGFMDCWGWREVDTGRAQAPDWGSSLQLHIWLWGQLLCKERNLDSGNLCPLETTILTARKPIIERHKPGVGVFTCIPSTAVAGTGGSIPRAHKSTKRFSEMRWDPVSKNKID